MLSFCKNFAMLPSNTMSWLLASHTSGEKFRTCRPSFFMTLASEVERICWRVASSANSRAFSAIMYCSAHVYQMPCTSKREGVHCPNTWCELSYNSEREREIKCLCAFVFVCVCVRERVIQCMLYIGRHCSGQNKSIWRLHCQMLIGLEQMIRCKPSVGEIIFTPTCVEMFTCNLHVYKLFAHIDIQIHSYVQ